MSDIRRYFDQTSHRIFLVLSFSVVLLALLWFIPVIPQIVIANNGVIIPFTIPVAFLFKLPIAIFLTLTLLSLWVLASAWQKHWLTIPSAIATTLLIALSILFLVFAIPAHNSIAIIGALFLAAISIALTYIFSFNLFTRAK